MTNHYDSMRELMNLFEDTDDSKILTEAGALSRFGNKIKAGLGNKNAQGAVDRDALSKQLEDNYNRWIGRTGQDSNLEALQTFLQKIGFENEEINGFTSEVVKFVTRNINNQDGEVKPVDVNINRNELGNVMDRAAEFAFKNNFNISGKQQQQQTSNNNTKTSQTATTDTNDSEEEVQPSKNDIKNLTFSDREIKKLYDVGVSDMDVRNLIADSKTNGFNRFDGEAKEKMAAIAYVLMRYTRGTNI